MHFCHHSMNDNDILVRRTRKKGQCYKQIFLVAIQQQRLEAKSGYFLWPAKNCSKSYKGALLMPLRNMKRLPGCCPQTKGPTLNKCFQDHRKWLIPEKILVKITCGVQTRPRFMFCKTTKRSFVSQHCNFFIQNRKIRIFLIIEHMHFRRKNQQDLTKCFFS